MVSECGKYNNSVSNCKYFSVFDSGDIHGAVSDVVRIPMQESL